MNGFSEHPIATAIGISIMVAAIGGVYNVGFRHGVKVGNATGSTHTNSFTFIKPADVEVVTEEDKKEDTENAGQSD